MAKRPGYLSSELFALAAAFAVLALTVTAIVVAEQNRRASGGALRHTMQVQNRLQSVYGVLRAAESDERGYLITGDDSYLDPYEKVTANLTKEVDALERLTADNDDHQRRITEIRPILRQRLDLLKQKIEMVKDGRQQDAIAIMRAGQGKALMDRIAALVGEMTAAEDLLYEAREKRLRDDSQSIKIAIGAMMLAIGGVGLFAIFLSHWQMTAIRTSRDAAAEAYEQLIAETKRRERLEEHLRQSQKLEAIGQLTGGVAHDFNNMLSVIVASLNILRRKLRRGDDDCESMIDSALQGADKAAALVKRLLAFARIQPLEPRELDVNKLVSNMSEILRRTLGGGVKLETVLAGGLWSTKIDANELENAILNLAVNARDAMPGGGRLTIETANCHLDEDYVEKNPDVKAGQYVMVAVTDTGQGMAPEIAARAFDPFFTTKPVGKGTGLGLSQAHGFVKQSGGHIKIYSEQGRGVTVKLYLPRFVPEPATAFTLAKATPLAPSKAGGAVLVVEDDPTAREVMVKGVRELGFTVLEADCGRAAIELLKARPDIFLLITDLVMPEMDGARLAREARFRRHNLHVLFVTGYSRNAVFHNGVLERDANVLSKPFTLDQLAGKISAMIEEPEKS